MKVYFFKGWCEGLMEGFGDGGFLHQRRPASSRGKTLPACDSCLACAEVEERDVRSFVPLSLYIYRRNATGTETRTLRLSRRPEVKSPEASGVRRQCNVPRLITPWVRNTVCPVDLHTDIESNGSVTWYSIHP